MDNTFCFSQALGLSGPWRAGHPRRPRNEGHDLLPGHLRCAARAASGLQRTESTGPRSDRKGLAAPSRLSGSISTPICTCWRAASAAGLSEVEAPWSGKGSGFSLTIEAFIVAPVPGDSGAGRDPLLDVSDGRSWWVLERQVQPARAQVDQTEIGRIAVDERSARCDQRFLSLFHDADQRRPTCQRVTQQLPSVFIYNKWAPLLEYTDVP